MQIVVKENNIRLDKYLALKTEYSRSNLQKMIEEEYVLVNNIVVKPKYLVNQDDIITIKEGFIKEINLEPEDIKLDIIFEDQYLIVINKPSGMVVHPGSGNQSGTLVNALLNHTKNLSNDEVRPGIVHRLDKDTSGLLVVAKNDKIHEILANDFKKRKVTRKYIALLEGSLKGDSATINAPIGRDNNDRKKMTVTNINSKEAISHLKVLKRFKDYTLVEFELVTGRTHQIRVHAKYINHPVYNDPVYTNKKTTSFGQFLHSSNLEFTHPVTKEKLSFESRLPNEFNNKISELS